MSFSLRRFTERRHRRAILAGALTASYAASFLFVAAPAAAARIPRAPARARVVYAALPLHGGSHARVLSNGIVQITSKDRKKVEYRALPVAPRTDDLAHSGGLPDKGQLIAQLSTSPNHVFVPGVVVVVFAPGTGPTVEKRDVTAQTLAALRTARATTPAFAAPAVAAPTYTSDARLNATLLDLGTDRIERLFRGFDRGSLGAMRSRAESATASRLLPFENAYRLHIAGSSVPAAVKRLLLQPGVLYASPDYRVTPMNVPSLHASPLSGRAGILPAGLPSGTLASPASTLPSNYALQSSFQSLLNAPAVNSAVAYDEIQKTYHQLPGAGEVITNVSLGDIDDLSNPKDQCYEYAQFYGPTTHVIGGQRYIDWPSMPLIAAYTSNVSGQITTDSTCGIDPFLGEVGLDFSMMAPLPHAQQRPGAVGSGMTDLLGVAPGATYRLVVPESLSDVGNTDIASAFLAAATQSPRPNVITASLGFGEDAYGYPSRYLEDDALTQAIVAAIVHNYNIVVCISSGDGLRTYTNAAFGPTGGSAPTDVVAPGKTPTSLDDVFASSVPSLDFDSGSIDVGGTTLDDIFAAPPQWTQSPFLKANHVYAETRWTGFTNFSSGIGSRVNVSAPSDNVIGFSHSYGGDYGAVDVGISGGTSASAPETAAVAAVALQVARLSGQPFASPLAVRSFLATTARPVTPIPQADRLINVGPQVDLGNIVETLLKRAGKSVPSAVPRVAVEQRRNVGNLDGAFQGDTDPRAIDLLGPVSSVDGTNTDRNSLAWITIAPDWEALPSTATFSLHLKSNVAKVLATTRYARLLPAEILAAIGQPLQSSSSRTVDLVYTATLSKTPGAKNELSIPVSLTFGPADTDTRGLHAPRVAPVITGATMAVTYDLSRTRNVSNPTLQVSDPGRINPSVGLIYHPQYEVPLYGLKGTVQVPVSVLPGGGIYGVGIHYGNVGGSDLYSDFAYTRIAPTKSNRPTAPLLAQGSAAGGHYLEIPYGTSTNVTWNVTNVPGATGAVIEVAGAGPAPFGSYQGFNNDNGTERDKNGIDSGSVAYVPVSGSSGTRAISASELGLIPTLYHTIRVLPTAGSSVVGEASEYSSITEDGVFALDGGYADNGFGVNANGDDGFITSSQLTAAGAILSSIESFDQHTNHITNDITTNPLVPFTLGWGIYANDIGVVGQSDYQTGAQTLNLLTPASTVNIGAAFTPPAALSIVEAAANTANDDASFEAYDPSGAGNDNFRVFTSNLTSNTTGPIYDISGPFLKMTFPSILGFGEDTSLHVGVAAGADFDNFCAQPVIAGIGLRDGKIASITGVGSGIPYGIAVDSITHKVAVPTACDSTVGLYSIPNRSSAYASLPGDGNGFYTAADQLHQRFLVEQTVSPDFSYNNNSLSSIYTLDESGNILKSIERFNLFNAFLSINANNLQVNPSSKRGYLFGYGAQQLEPFTY